MTTNEPAIEEGIAAQLAHDAHYVGTDGESAHHYWSIYEQTAYVVDGESVDSWALAETPLETLGDWVTHVRTRRGPWREHCVTSGGFVGLVTGQGGA